MNPDPDWSPASNSGSGKNENGSANLVRKPTNCGNVGNLIKNRSNTGFIEIRKYYKKSKFGTKKTFDSFTAKKRRAVSVVSDIFITIIYAEIQEGHGRHV